ncbi:efflux RND transporter periplasmic adaptor subunit [Salinimonas chungwhensis]|uniref:efflux RND transporter periplasmic adaptor subunit n=1 Tax=Salinimonas chungwhensis TaxID=265425 RepID=UPI000375878A|nr:efflux RND transporter periplasmic adaptor subunit [Salinimonas chungwhensis]
MINKSIIFSLLAGALTGAIIVSAYLWLTETTPTTTASAQQKPLYWVAPMDDSYRRDKPGKSPMGMDLVPVYKQNEQQNAPAGTVTISSVVEQNMGVRTAVASTSAINNDINTVGFVAYDEDEIVHIHPRVEGWIEEQFVKAAGDPVEQGQPLYSLYSPQLVTAQEELIIALKRGNPSLIQAARERLKALGVSSDVIRMVSESRAIVRDITFYAPQSGFVNALNIRDGFYVKPGMTLMSIARLDSVWVEAHVYETDASAVQTDMPVTMTVDAVKGKIWHGNIAYIAPSLKPDTRTLPVRLKFKNPQQILKPNMLANVHISLPDNTGIVSVPKEAVIRTGTMNRVVLAMGDGKFRSVAVTLGRAGENNIEILEGLKPGAEVVTSAQFLIDSESSKTADFARIDTPTEADNTAWAEGVIEGKSIANRQVTIRHAPVQTWSWPAMTMTFAVAKTIDMEKLKPDAALHFKITKTQDMPVVSAIHVIKNSPAAESYAGQGQGDKDSFAPEKPRSIAILGKVTAVKHQTRMVTIDHEPVEAWQWPAMVMDFAVDDSVDMDSLAPDQTLHFEVTRQDDESLLITGIHIMSQPGAKDKSDASHDHH